MEEDNTAAAMGSGSLEVFATPAMVALMEQAAAESVNPYLKDEETTVGILMNVKHLSATALGGNVKAESVLTQADGRKLCFAVKAYDDAGLIGEGTHERFIVNSETFMERAVSK